MAETPQNERQCLQYPQYLFISICPDARVNPCKRKKCDFPTPTWIKPLLCGCERYSDWPASKRAQWICSWNDWYVPQLRKKTIRKFKQVYSEEFKSDIVILWAHIWVCVMSPFWHFLGHLLAWGNWGLLSAVWHDHTSLLAPSPSFRKCVFGVSAKLLPLFTLCLPIPCSFVTHVSV